MSMSQSLSAAWYRGAGWLYLLWPLSLVFRALAAGRRLLLQRRRERQSDPGSPGQGAAAFQGRVPVVVVGNIAVGGTGKTPFVIALCRALQERHLRPGLVSRGYGASPPAWPWRVAADSPPAEAGDEALVLKRSLDCPLVLDPRRPRAVEELLASGDCDVILSDDGLQHYALARDLELAVVDARRRFGNGLCLPAGPLREPPARLREVDFIVVNGEDSGRDRDYARQLSRRFGTPAGLMWMRPGRWVNLLSGDRRPPAAVPAAKVHAVAGIGNPRRFFESLRGLGIDAIEHEFPDHHRFVAGDLDFGDELPVVMTEKDAVKAVEVLRGGAEVAAACWYLTVEAQVDSELMEALVDAVTVRARTADKRNRA